MEAKLSWTVFSSGSEREPKHGGGMAGKGFHARNSLLSFHPLVTCHPLVLQITPE